MISVCIAEDRKACEPALKLLIMSLDRNCRDLSVHVFYPPADNDFKRWTKAYLQVELHTEPLPKAYHWNVKPHAILRLMERGCDEIIWIDSDVIVVKNILSLFEGLDGDTIVVAEEALWGAYEDPNALRTRLWGFKVGRVLPFTLNSAVVRVTRSHAALLNRWKDLLESQDYKEAQTLDWRNKPLHMMGDQDVLSALLSSSQYAHIPIEILRRGDSIVQYLGLSGYTVLERMKNLFGRSPTFIHSQGRKPWTDDWYDHYMKIEGKSRVRNYLELVYLDLSPYTLSAMLFIRKLDDGGRWTRPHFFLSAVLRAIGLWYPPLVGLPIAAAIDFVSLARRVSFAKRRGG